MEEKNSPRSYPRKLAKWLNEQKGSTSNYKKHLVAFLAAKDAVKEALAAGYTMKDIWLHLHAEGKISFSYKSFTLYVRRYLKENQHERNPLSTSIGAGRRLKKHSEEKMPSERNTEKPKKSSTIGSVFKIDHTLTEKDII